MKNILILNGATRINGNTAKLLNAFIDGAESKGHHIDKFDLQTMNIHDCIGCSGCKKPQEGRDNPCIQNDDMKKIYSVFAKSDVIVLASPVYFFSITGILKTAVDRLYAVCNNLSPEDSKKESILLMTAGAPEYSQPKRWYSYFEKYLGWKNIGEVLGAEKTQEARELGASL